MIILLLSKIAETVVHFIHYMISRGQYSRRALALRLRTGLFSSNVRRIQRPLVVSGPAALPVDDASAGHSLPGLVLQDVRALERPLRRARASAFPVNYARRGRLLLTEDALDAASRQYEEPGLPLSPRPAR